MFACMAKLGDEESILPFYLLNTKTRYCSGFLCFPVDP